MNAPLAPAHSPFGGSIAGRILRCPASVGLTAQVPAHLRKTSIHATRGGTLHSAMGLLIEEKRCLDDLVGETIDGYTITADDVETGLRPAYAYVSRLLDTPGAEFYLEQRVAFPTVPGAFGTLDRHRNGATLMSIDFKFGNLPVRALYPDSDDDIINPQPCFAPRPGASRSLEFFAGVDNIVLTILQPMSIETDAEIVSSVTVTHGELDEFIAVYRAACEEALSPSPRLARGAHCRFCQAQPICPEHVRPLLDLGQFASPAPSALPSKQAYLQVLADGLSLVDAIKAIGKALHDQAKAALENGDSVPGYTLTTGRAVRHWRNENDALTKLIALGLVRDDIIAETMRSPKQVELRAKARGLKVPPEFIVSTCSGTSLTRVENAHAPVPGRDELVRSFSAALK
jgi:hypothetical protein